MSILREHRNTRRQCLKVFVESLFLLFLLDNLFREASSHLRADGSEVGRA